MAIFASTTTSGYSDPMKALSIKALEKRQADLMAQNAKGGEITPENTQTPIQGMGHVVNALADNFKEGRAMSAVAAQKELLARTIAGMDPMNPKPQELAVIGTADPELLRQHLTIMAENRRAQMQHEATLRGQDLTAETSRRGQDITQQGQQLTADVTREGHGVTREGNRLSADTQQRGQDLQAASSATATDVTQQGQKLAAETQVRGQDLTAAQQAAATDVTQQGQKNQAEIAEADRLSREKNAQVTAQAAVEAAAADPTKVKARAEIEQMAVQKNALVAELDDAGKAFTKGINLGPGSTAKTLAGQVPIIGDYIGDPEKAARTKQFMNTMDKVATGAMSTILKGATTDKEMAEFKRMYNDPNIPLEAKVNQFNRVLEAAKADRDIENRAVRATGGTPQEPATANPVSTDPLEGKIADGPDGPMIRRNGAWVKQ